jgi:hypothetical protein
VTSPSHRRAPSLVLALVVGLVVAGGAAPARGEGLSERILEDRYGRGDYAIFLGWHDPWDWTFDEHASATWPFGLKARLNLGRWLRTELDLSYFRSTGEPDYTVSLYNVPHFDGLWFSSVVQVAAGSYAGMRPYVGAGPVVVSLTNEFLVIRLDVAEAFPDRPEQRAIARWSRFDVGGLVVAGIDLPIGRRAFPFVEYRHLFGRLSLDPQSVKLSGQSLASLNLEVEDLTTIPADATPGVVGRKYSTEYDWSGPVVIVGLKIRF